MKIQKLANGNAYQYIGEGTGGGVGMIEELENSDWNLQNFQFTESKTPRKGGRNEGWIRSPPNSTCSYIMHFDRVENSTMKFFITFENIVLCFCLSRSSLCKMKPIFNLIQKLFFKDISFPAKSQTEKDAFTGL